MENYESNLLEKYINNIIPNLTVAVVGLSGTGSIVCQSLAHIGVRSFILIDNDILDKLNLKKVVGSIQSDVDVRSKCNIMYDMINSISNKNCDIKTIHKKFNRNTKDEIRHALKHVDFIFSCVDDPLGRIEINNFCVKTKKPFIVCGVGMKKDNEIIKSLSGQIFFIKPGDPCYECYKIENGLEYGDRNIPYIHINSIIANLGIMEFIKYFSGFGKTYHRIDYDALKQTIKTYDIYKNNERCTLCKSLEY